MNNLLPIIEFLDRASASGLKWPKVRLSADGHPLVLRRNGARSKSPGSVSVTDGGPYGSSRYYGRIERNGEFYRGFEYHNAVGRVLQALANDPECVTAAWGKRFGKCCMCGLALSDARSVTVGYGPVCAQKWGLPWGEADPSVDEYREEPLSQHELVLEDEYLERQGL